MSDRRYLRPFYTELWVAVVSINRPMSAYEFRKVPLLKSISCEHHGHIKDALEALAADRYLIRYAGCPPTYGYASACSIPRGCSAPSGLVGTGFEVAGPRRLCSESMPRDYAYTAPAPSPDTRPPSRIGNKLHWRDGRITDLEGN